MRCTGQHHYSECPKKKTETPQCVNCGELGHTANFRGCKYYQELKLKSIKKSPPESGGIRGTETSTSPKQTKQNPINLTLEKDFPQTLVSSATKSFASAVKRSLSINSSQPTTSSSPNESTVDSSSLMSNLEKIIIDLVKSCMPIIKQVVSNVMSSFLNGCTV